MFFTLQYLRLPYTIPHYSTRHYITLLHYINYITPQLEPQLQLQLRYTNYTI